MLIKESNIFFSSTQAFDELSLSGLTELRIQFYTTGMFEIEIILSNSTYELLFWYNHKNYVKSLILNSDYYFQKIFFDG
jgi:hypothetical protein